MDLDWRQRRTITVLSTILSILVVAVLVVGGYRYRQHRQAQAETLAEGVNTVVSTQYTYTAITYSNKTAKLSFAVDEETDCWYWADDPDFPLDDTVITEICTMLTALKPQQTLTAEEPLENYSLDVPFASLSASSGSGEALTIAFGKTTTDGTSYYTLINGDETTLYIIDGAIYEKMEVPIYDMMVLPVLPALTAENLQSITISGEMITDLSAQRPESGEAATWRSNGANVTDIPVTSSILEELETLTLVKCVDYKPTDEAVSLCGFDTPVTVEVTYLTEGGSELSADFSLGSKTLDESGYYFRMDGDTSIYQVAADSMDTLLSVAASGLEG